jgi:hypothetical protein
MRSARAGSVASDRPSFIVARNPDPDSALPYLLRIPVDGGSSSRRASPGR